MIKIIDDWYITVEANPINYVVRHGDGEKDKNGKMKDRGIAYFSTLRGAVKFIRGQNYRRRTFRRLADAWGCHSGYR